MLGIAASVALFIGMVGIYGVVAYAAAQRTREIGVRMALGAARADVLRLVVTEGMRLSLVGLGIGLLLAAGIGVVLSRVLYGVVPLDVPVLGGVVLLLLVVSALACYVPARRATRIDPLVALRYE
jgi:ABC-type antimicrobial peptide transport system permease subunit